MSIRIVLELARDMAGYMHHCGYPVYDGGHSEPEDQCQHPDCLAVRTIAAELKAAAKYMTLKQQ